MSDEEILQACNLRLRNWRWSEISAKLHYDPATIRYHIEKYVLGEGMGRGLGKYPYIREWTREQRITAETIAEAFGCTPNFVVRVLNCHRKMPEDMVDWFVRVSGLPRHQVLAKEKAP